MSNDNPAKERQANKALMYDTCIYIIYINTHIRDIWEVKRKYMMNLVF